MCQMPTSRRTRCLRDSAVRHLQDDLRGVHIAAFPAEHRRRGERTDRQDNHADAVDIRCRGQADDGSEKACEHHGYNQWPKFKGNNSN
jgi:hypothetical protein